jgi:hypothetical protein
MANDPFLSSDDIKELVQTKLKANEEFSILEQYAMFMGKAQILEFGLKGLLTRRYGISPDFMERWTLGYVKNELKKNSLRPDFIALLESVVDHRNYIAHEFLLNNTITKTIASFSDRKLSGDLFRAIYELEQLIIIYDWSEENKSWS